MFHRITNKVARLLRRVGATFASFTAAITSPIEALFHWIGRVFVAGAQWLEHADSVLLAPLRILVLPLRGFVRLVGRILRSLVPQRLSQFVIRSLEKAKQGILYLAELLNLDGAVLWLVWLLKPVWLPCASLYRFTIAWAATRRWRAFIPGIPAALLAVVVVVAAGWWFLRGKSATAAQYRVAVKQALEDKNFERVQLLQRKLAQLDVDSRRTDYETALALANDGNIAEAYGRMKQLAPEDTAGFGPAHWWIVDQVMQNSLGLSNQENQRLLRVHLKQLKLLGAKGLTIDYLNALWLAREKRQEEASQALEPLVYRLPAAAMLRMRLDLSLGNTDEAKSDARAIRLHMSDRRRHNATFSANDYRSWTIAEKLLENYDASREAAHEWLKLEPDNREARTMLSELCGREFNELMATPNPDPNVLADLFIEAAEMAEDRHELQRQVLRLYRQRDHNPVAKQVINLVARSPRAQSAILEAAGTAAAEAGNYSQAATYLMEAIKKDPKNAIAWNNYAYILTQRPKPDYNEALKAANKALEILPEEYNFRETRGQVLARLGRWKEAIPDLEFAMNGMPTSKAIHETLANAYDAVGDKELARLHRQEAQ